MQAYTINEMGPPPGTVQFADNAYVDYTELTNLNYREFLLWTKRIYGKEADEYIQLLPDTTVWLTKLSFSLTLGSYYFSHPAYNSYPIVGVSYKQANAFSKWRSDRALETFLVNKKIIPFRPYPPKDSVFTIEKYFTGKYYNIKPNPAFSIYAEYRLPDSSSYFRIAPFADSFNKENYPSCHGDFYKKFSLIDCFCLEISAKSEDIIAPCSSNFCKGELITHLKGNVREMTDTEGVFYGSSFHEPCSKSYTTCSHDTNLVNSYTGFRNSCSYKVWDLKAAQ